MVTNNNLVPRVFSSSRPGETLGTRLDQQELQNLQPWIMFCENFVLTIFCQCLAGSSNFWVLKTELKYFLRVQFWWFPTSLIDRFASTVSRVLYKIQEFFITFPNQYFLSPDSRVVSQIPHLKLTQLCLKRSFDEISWQRFHYAIKQLSTCYSVEKTPDVFPFILHINFTFHIFFFRSLRIPGSVRTLSCLLPHTQLTWIQNSPFCIVIKPSIILSAHLLNILLVCTMTLYAISMLERF